jgi:hypothetical protein
MYRSHDVDGRPNYELMLNREAISSGASATTHNSE